MGRTRRGGVRLPIVLDGEWSKEKNKNREGGGALNFDGFCWMVRHNNQLKAGRIVVGYIWVRRRTGRRQLGRTPSHLFGLWVMGQKINKIKFVVA
jgi:hypothetical protein